MSIPNKERKRLILSETLQNWINILQTIANLPLGFGPCKNDLSVDENQQNHPWFHHPVDQARKQFRLVRAKLPVHLVQVLQSNRKSEIYRRNQVLHFELQEAHVVAQLLYDSCKFPRRQIGTGFVTSPGADDLPRSEHQRRTAGLPDSHHDTVKPSRIVLGVSQSEVDCLEV